MFDEVVVAVGVNIDKRGFFPNEKRMEIIRQATAGLDGVSNQYSPEECAERLHFPRTLGVLIKELENNQFALDTFGEKLCQMYAEGKKEEWDRFCAYVTDWETKEYLYRC